MLTPAWTPLRYHEQQDLMWRTKARFVNAACGRGSGKTEIARRRVVRMLPVLKDWSDPIYFYALPTMTQARRVAWEAIKKLVPSDWLSKPPSETGMYIETKYGSRLYVVGLDKPQRIEGVQWDGGVVDESSDQRPGSFGRSILPALQHRNGWCWRIGVPKRYGIGAADFKSYFDLGLKGEDPDIQSFSWKSDTVLTEAQLRFARDNLSEQDYDEQMGASWLSAGGAIFSSFNEQLDVDKSVKYDPDRPIIVGSDFNVDPMSWVLAQQFGDELHCFDEIFKRNTTTRATLNLLWAAYGDMHRSRWLFYGDASSRARKTSASSSDYIQIVNDDRFEPKQVLYPKANPSRSDRFASCNSMFCTASGVRRVKIHPKLKHLITDLNTRAFEEGTNQPDDRGDTGHISDAFGYICHGRWPLRLDTGSIGQVGVYAGD